MLNKSLEGASTRDVKEIELEIKKIASAIQVYRSKKKLTQEALAEVLDVSVNTIKYIEQGRRIPSLPMLFRICRKIGLEVHVLPQK